MRQTTFVMGTGASLDIPGCEDKQVFEAAFGRLRQIDKRFSTYKPDSEVSSFASGRLKESELSAELKEVISACRTAQKYTGGYFSAWYGDNFDPSGYVKGWAIAEAGREVEKKGYKTYCLGIGGDILARSAGEKIWNIGIQDPRDKSKILNTLSISNGAVATSGNYERGAHIINPKTKKPAGGLLAVTVAGPDIAKADVLATACFAMGDKAAKFMKNQAGYQALIIPRSPGSNHS